MMRLLDGVGVGVADDALLCAVAVEELQALVKSRRHHTILMYPWPPQEGRVRGVRFDDEEPHLEAES
jgi:hypothetical protein